MPTKAPCNDERKRAAVGLTRHYDTRVTRPSTLTPGEARQPLPPFGGAGQKQDGLAKIRGGAATALGSGDPTRCGPFRYVPGDARE